MKTYDAQCVLPLDAELGEGPVYLPEQARLYFVDIKRGFVHCLDERSGAHQQWTMPDLACWLIPRRDGDGFIAGLRDRVVHLRLAPVPTLVPLVHPLAGQAGVRLNDAKADPQGRIWFGSMHDTDQAQAVGTLFRLDTDLTLHRMDSGYHICNGPAVSEDGRTLYHADSYLGEVYRYEVDDAGALGPRSAWQRFTGSSPDGMNTDREGAVWIAHWGGRCVRRYAPDGTLLAEVRVPVSQPSSIAFGGADLRTLYITTAREGLTPEQLAAEPLAGCIFSARIDVAGLAPNRFGA